ncbi:MAG: hypothetical protein JW953_15060 [Anaerolineae bacterium]|nr:hypothetical protein [Anaerolineae bacterium]
MPQTKTPLNNTKYAIRHTLPLFLFLFAVYLLTYTPRINSSDGLAMFSTAESLARRGALDIEQIRWMGLQQGTYGLNGLPYSRKGIGLPLALLPLTWLGLVIPWLGPVSVSLLFNAIVTALTAVILLVYLRRLGSSQRAGFIVALTYGLATLAWPYAKSLFSDPFSGFLLLAAAYALLKFRHILQAQSTNSPASLPPSILVYPLLAGLCLGWNVATRYAEILFLSVFGILLLYYLRFGRTPRLLLFRQPILWPGLIAFTTPILFIGLGLLVFNITRYGDPFNTGYLPQETFSAVLWQGVVGQLLSPGRGLLLYCPIFILSFWGFRPALRRFPAEALLALGVILIHLFLYGKWFMWHGGFAWGPRFMIPTLPFWTVFLAPVAARAFPGPNTKNRSGLIFRLAYLILAGLGLIPQLLAVSTDFTPFQNYLLDTGLSLFAPQTFFHPQYSPLLNAWTFITPHTLDLAWAWQGRFNGWLLALLLANVIITGWYLKSANRQMVNRKSQIANGQKRKPFTVHNSQFTIHNSSFLLPLSFSLLSLLSLLLYTHTLPSQPLSQAIAALNEAIRPTDAVITNDPEMAMPLAELYQGRAPVLGLNYGGFPLPSDATRRLDETMTAHQQIWWLPNWLPPAESAIEQTLLTRGFRARNDNFDGQRLVLFAFPQNLANQAISPNAVFANLIALNQVAYPPTSPPGAALPLELHWQALAPISENYHVFIHLLSDTGQIVAQADGQPVYWTRPTSTWSTGRTIVDRYGLWLPQGAPSGQYQLLIGLYRPAHNQRLLLSNEQDAVKFIVTVQ